MLYITFVYNKFCTYCCRGQLGMAYPSACGRLMQHVLGTQTGAPTQNHKHLYYDQISSMTSHQSKVSEK